MNQLVYSGYKVFPSESWLLKMLKVPSSLQVNPSAQNSAESSEALPSSPLSTGSPASPHSGSQSACARSVQSIVEAQPSLVCSGACNAVRVNVLIAEHLGEPATEPINAINPDVANIKYISQKANNPQELSNLVLQALQTEKYNLLVVRGNCRVSQEFVDNIPIDKKPEFILRAGTGLDNLDTEYLKQAGIAYDNTPSVNTEGTAELAMTMMLNVARKISEANQKVKNGDWDRNELTGFELNGRTLGVVGVGKIGSAVASAAKGLGMQVLGLTPRHGVPSKIPDYLSGYADLDELCAKADVLTLHVPLEASTHHLIGQHQLELLAGTNGSKKAILVNVARGGIVDEAALLKALDQGQLYGAGIDVFEQDPAPKGSISDQLARHSLVLSTPHVGGQTIQASRKMGEAVVEQINKMHQQLNQREVLFSRLELNRADSI